MSSHQPSPPADSLVLYKVKPARVLRVGDKIEIELEGGDTKRVRAKDLELLHPGPLRSLDELSPQRGEPDEAWALLEGGETDLRELAELTYSAFTPATAWAAWQLVAEGLRFSGVPSAIQARPRAEVERDRADRAARAAAEQEWKSFLDRMAAAAPERQDWPRLQEVERLALGRSEHSRILQALGYQESSENAHRALVQVGYWNERHNPYPARCGVATEDPELPVPSLPEEERLDLTGLPAFAIDDQGNQDPDDALSLEGDRLWVHVADVAALVHPAGEIEREARSRGSNLYAPEGIVNMLPVAITEGLGLGLHEVSPALSIAMRVDDRGEPHDVEVHRTWIRAQRLTYEEVELRLAEEPFAGLRMLGERVRARRESAGATSLDLPEVSVRVIDGEVVIRPVLRLLSRTLVADAMLLAGEAVAGYCLDRGIAIPFASQAPGEATTGPQARGLAAMYARRRTFRPTRLVASPEPHAGLGLNRYTRATSPLRRYADLLVHQQLRAWLVGRMPLTEQEVTQRIAEAELGSAAVRRAERLSNLHWKLIYLKEHPHWRGEGILVAKEERKDVILIPDLALETRLRLKGEPGLDTHLCLALRGVDIPAQTVEFRVLA
ncbi:MAG: RNB domain-containing ribonuclease [Bdellovibrio bacteriovorus]